jgi:hypothetical protein
MIVSASVHSLQPSAMLIFPMMQSPILLQELPHPTQRVTLA